VRACVRISWNGGKNGKDARMNTSHVCAHVSSASRRVRPNSQAMQRRLAHAATSLARGDEMRQRGSSEGREGNAKGEGGGRGGK
jgi:hypothetical protein